MARSMTIGEFINECYAYPYSRAYFELYKEGLEFDLVAQYLESMDAAEDYEMVESGAVSDPNYFCPYDESVEEKYASYFQEKDTGDGRGESWDKDLPFFPRIWNWIKITAQRFWDAVVGLFKKVEKTEQTAEEAQAEEGQAVEEANDAAENGQAEGADGTGAPASSGSGSSGPRVNLKKARSLLDYQWTTEKIAVLFKDKSKNAWENCPFQGRLNTRHVKFANGVSDSDKKAVINFISFVREKESITVSLRNKEDVKRFMGTNGHTAFEVDRVCDLEGLGELYRQVGKVKRMSDLNYLKKLFWDARRSTLGKGITVKCGADLSEDVKAIEAIRDNVGKALNDAMIGTANYKKAKAGSEEAYTASDYVFGNTSGTLNFQGEEKKKRREAASGKMAGMGKTVAEVSKLFSESCGSTLAIYTSLIGTMRRYHGKGQLHKLVTIASGLAK